MDYITTRLDLRPHLYKNLILQINHHFKYTHPNSFENDFYPLIQEENWSNCYLLLDKKNEHTILGHIGVKYKKLFFKQNHCKVAMLGGIFIDENAQGKGLFTTLFNYILTELEEDTSALFLWSDLSELYIKKGFFLAGGITNYEINQETILDQKTAPSVHCIKTKLKQLTQKQLKECQELYKNTSSQWITFERNHDDWQSLINVTSIDCFIGTDQSDHIIYYFLKNKGKDLEGIIHEYAYIPSLKEEMMKAIEETKSLLWVPEGDLFNLKRPSTSISLAFIKILKENLLLAFLQKILHPVIIFRPSQHPREGDLLFEYNGKEYESTLQEFLLNLWGPYRYTEWKNIFPPLFISGGESI